MTAARATEARIARALRACQAAQVAIGTIEVLPDGTVRIIPPPSATVPVDSAPESPQPRQPRKWTRR
jgi:hypothetical protein